MRAVRVCVLQQLCRHSESDSRTSQVICAFCLRSTHKKFIDFFPLLALIHSHTHKYISWHYLLLSSQFSVTWQASAPLEIFDLMSIHNCTQRTTRGACWPCRPSSAILIKLANYCWQLLPLARPLALLELERLEVKCLFKWPIGCDSGSLGSFGLGLLLLVSTCPVTLARQR